MTEIIGKRKRREHVSGQRHSQNGEQQSSYDSQLRDLLRQNFENRFKPLESYGPVSGQNTFLTDDIGSDDEQSDWSGFSEEDEADTDAVVVHYQHTSKTPSDFSREDLKVFMSAKPPLEDLKPVSPSKWKTTETQNPEEAATDAANLKKDLALERLLQESHLLDPMSSLTPSGRNRHKAIDVRQQALGSKTSVFAQQKMPLAQRRGIALKSTEREGKRRREAKEGGIVLEKAVKPKLKDPKRERGIGAPNVGKFSRGMLTLSKKDVSMIVGPAKKSKRK
ncbi:MAG: hypothetical protein Q9168_003499 [Polycauliona sp. 1 TL-2023]